MNNKKVDFEKYLNRTSSRHHYIPKFLISGFVNSNGLLFVYDKYKDEILKKPRSPKSMFFQTDRNTIEITDTIKSSIIEDLFYAEIDNRISKVIKYFQVEELLKIDFKIEDTSMLLFFLITLFWRLPITDYASEELISKSTILSEDIDPEVLRNDPTFKKLNRAVLFKHHIDEMANFGVKGRKWSNIHENGNDIYLIGDFPFLFRKQPDYFKEFDESDMLFAVSSKRIYSSTNVPLDKFTFANSFCYNAAIINQSVRYVAGADFNLLKESVNFYKKLRETGSLIQSTEKAFVIE